MGVYRVTASVLRFLGACFASLEQACMGVYCVVANLNHHMGLLHRPRLNYLRGLPLNCHAGFFVDFFLSLSKRCNMFHSHQNSLKEGN